MPRNMDKLAGELAYKRKVREWMAYRWYVDKHFSPITGAPLPDPEQALEIVPAPPAKHSE